MRGRECRDWKPGPFPSRLVMFRSRGPEALRDPEGAPIRVEVDVNADPVQIVGQDVLPGGESIYDGRDAYFVYVLVA
jgi:hypothetical protein